QVAAAAKGAGDKCLRLEFSVAPAGEGQGLVSCGVLIVNPPWTLAAELRTVLPELQKPLGQGGAGRAWRLHPRAGPARAGSAQAGHAQHVPGRPGGCRARDHSHGPDRDPGSEGKRRPAALRACAPSPARRER
ncbi:MAG: 23S rRNA (adenine(2030)-N(6))-methyltransferase RlmJ, partial [Delftia acidovorans]|nr:23S rRNA (adenine(2030)-N(6))-methyltransferase RlmJ [Delftia acidovorans]